MIDHSEDPDTLFDLGRVWKAQGEHSNAVKIFSEVVRLKPGWDEAYVSRANCYRWLQEWQLAAEDFVEAIRLGYREGRIFESAGYCYQRLAEYQKAIDYYTTEINEGPP